MSFYDDQAEHDQTIEDEVDEVDDSDQGPARTTRSTRTSRAARDRLVRKVAAKAGEVAAAPAPVRMLAASLLGCKDDVTELTTSIVLDGRTALRPIQDLKKIADADPFEAAVVAGALETARRRKVWNLLDALGFGTDGDLPVSSSKAGVTVARTVHSLDMADIEAEMVDVIELLQRP